MKKLIKLRALEPDDIDFLYNLENDTDLWHLSNQQQFFSKNFLIQYIKEADRDIYEVKQYRFAIEKIESNELLGFVDLFDFDPKNKRVGVGIIIKEQKERQKGYAKEALNCVIDYCFNILYLHQIYANISVCNKLSIILFESLGFEQNGLKKEWNFDGEKYIDEYFYQLLKK